MSFVCRGYCLRTIIVHEYLPVVRLSCIFLKFLLYRLPTHRFCVAGVWSLQAPTGVGMTLITPLLFFLSFDCAFEILLAVSKQCTRAYGSNCIAIVFEWALFALFGFLTLFAHIFSYPVEFEGVWLFSLSLCTSEFVCLLCFLCWSPSPLHVACFECSRWSSSLEGRSYSVVRVSPFTSFAVPVCFIQAVDVAFFHVASLVYLQVRRCCPPFDFCLQFL